jgi:hypothetical protein
MSESCILASATSWQCLSGWWNPWGLTYDAYVVYIDDGIVFGQMFQEQHDNPGRYLKGF